MPHAPQITTTSPTGHTTTVPNSSSAHSASVPAQLTATTPSTTPNATLLPPSTAATANVAATPDRSAERDELNFNEQLNAADRYWKFKMALQIAMSLASIIGIGCLGWALSTTDRLSTDWSYGYDSSWSLPWGLITFSISLIWCFVCIMRLVIAKRPVHPGVRVTMDLLLWLGFLVTALFTMYALLDLLYWGDDGDMGSSLGYSNQHGNYVLQRNDTWVWETSKDYAGVTYERTCNGSSSSTYNEPLPFHNCAEMDAYVNTLWHEKGNRARVELTAVVTQWLGLLLHFTLFVWACVDCHKYRQSRVSKDAEKLAAGIVQNMVQNGVIVPPLAGQAHMHGADWLQAYQQLPSGANSFSGQGGLGSGGYGPGGYGGGGYAQGQHPAMGQMGPQMQTQMRGPISGEQVQAGPSSGKDSAQDGGVPTSYYEPQR